MNLLDIKRKLISVTVLMFAFANFTSAQQGGMTLTEYIETYRQIAMEEMVKHGIPASIKLGQGILESGFGNSDLAVKANNHFGIKCHGWQGRSFYKDDDEVNECFRAYDDPRQSFRDHSEFITGRPRYAGLFEIDVTDYRGWARGLRQAGYATNPRYADLLIGIIERNNLYEFDRMVLASGDVKPGTHRKADRESSPYTTTRTARGDDFPTVGVGREIQENNRIRYVYARQGDTPESLAQELGLWAWEIYRYNEMERSDRLQQGQIVYLQPKRRNASQSWHVVNDGETMYEISQKYGVRLRMLYRRNNIEPGSEPVAGQRIQLKAWPSR